MTNINEIQKNDEQYFNSHRIMFAYLVQGILQSATLKEVCVLFGTQ